MEGANSEQRQGLRLGRVLGALGGSGGQVFPDKNQKGRSQQPPIFLPVRWALNEGMSRNVLRNHPAGGFERGMPGFVPHSLPIAAASFGGGGRGHPVFGDLPGDR